jgi:hypothetical protein
MNMTTDQPDTGWPARRSTMATDPILGWPDGFARRALTAARRERFSDPTGFDHRYDDNLFTWARRARLARDIAVALDIPCSPTNITITDDPHPRPGQVRGRPADLITVTDGRSVWRFIPDPAMPPGDRWILLDECPDCGAPTVPMIPIATLADVGDWIDPDADDRYTRVMEFGMFYGDPTHHPGCQYGS